MGAGAFEAISFTEIGDISEIIALAPLTGGAAAGSASIGLATPLSAQFGGSGLDASLAANGAVLIGNGTGFTLATLTAGANITITNAAGSITIASTGGAGAPVEASYVVLGLHASLTGERVLVGTVNRVTIADGGANGNVTLSAPQDIHAGARPTFAGLLLVPAALSGAPSTAGAWFSEGTATYTDNATATSGTAALHVFNGFAQPTLAATNLTVTTTDAATHYIAGAPIAGANQTITRPWAFFADAGNVRIDDKLFVGDAAASGINLASAFANLKILASGAAAGAVVFEHTGGPAGSRVFAIQSAGGQLDLFDTNDAFSAGAVNYISLVKASGAIKLYKKLIADVTAAFPDIGEAGNGAFGNVFLRGAGRKIDFYSGNGTITHSITNDTITLNGTPAPGVGANGSIFRVTGTITEFGSGTHAVLAGCRFDAPTITGGAALVTDATTVYIPGAPTATGANSWALLVPAGNVQFGGKVGIGTTNPTVQLQVGVGNPGFSASIVTINSADVAISALTISNWDGAATTNGPRLEFDNSGIGAWLLGGSDGANNFDIATAWGTPSIRAAASIADGETAVLVRRNVGGTFTLQRVTMGAVDSGGAGFKLLRIPN